MNEKRLKSFDDFLATYSGDFTDVEPRGGLFELLRSNLLFRGHSSSEWMLETSLERFGQRDYPLGRYILRVRQCWPEFTSYQRSCNLSDSSLHLGNSKVSWDALVTNSELLSVMIHLRHLGFPSPLLDWTRSPFIAAFFAYEQAKGDEDVALFVYRERDGNGKMFDQEGTNIQSIGPTIKTSTRHHSQQAEYTVCIRKSEDREFFYSHESRFNELLSDPDPLPQDRLVKYVLPGSERKSVLNHLQLMNINAFTLFHSEEGLAKYLAWKTLN